MAALTGRRAADDAGVWITLRQSSRPVRAILVGVLINQLGGFLQTFLVLFLTERGFSAIHAATALGGYGIGGFAGVLIGGSLSDRLGPRFATFLSMAGFAGLLVAVLYLRNFPLLLAVVTLAGLVGRFYRPAVIALLSEMTPPHQQVMIFAVYRLAVNLGTTAAPLLATALIAVSYQVLFWFDAVTALAYGLIAVAMLPGRRPTNRPASRTERRQNGYLAVLADRRYLLYLVAVTVNAAVYIQYVSTLPLAMTDAGYATIWYSIAIAMNGLIVICCELLLTKVTQRLPLALVVTIGFGLLALGQLCYAAPWGVWVIEFGTLIWTVAEITAGPTMAAYPGRAGPTRLRGRYIASMQTMFNLGLATGPVLGVAIYRAVGNTVWVWCALGSAVGLVLALLGMRNPQPETTAVAAADPAGADAGPDESAAAAADADALAGSGSELADTLVALPEIAANQVAEAESAR